LKTQRNHFHKEEFSADWYMDTHTWLKEFYF
jgi:hypothetical protein